MADPSLLTGNIHTHPVRVYYEDTDSGGVVYYANYLRFAERARTEMLRATGVSHDSMAKQEGLAFAVRSCEVDFLKPAHLDDALEVDTGNIAPEAASLWLDQVVRRGREVLVTMRLRLVCIGENGRPARLPKRLRAALQEFYKSGD